MHGRIENSVLFILFSSMRLQSLPIEALKEVYGERGEIGYLTIEKERIEKKI
jgi:hypothetical protein